MVEHWEYITLQAKGNYILILTDRSVLKSQALSTIHHAIHAQKNEVKICSWGWNLYDDKSLTILPALGHRPENTENTHLLKSSKMASEFISRKHKYPFALPRGLNSCYHRSLAEKIREQHGRLFFANTPDFTSAFLLMSYENEVLYIDSALFLSQGLDVSNGAKAYSSTAEEYLNSLGDHDSYRYVPIKAPLVENAVYNDYLFIQQLTSRVLADFDWVEYFVVCYIELLDKKSAKLLPPKAINRLFEIWMSSLVEFDEVTQKRVNARVKSLYKHKLKTYLKSSALRKPLLRARALWNHLAAPDTRKHHSNVLSAAGFKVNNEDCPG